MNCKRCNTEYPETEPECPECKKDAQPFYRKNLKDGEEVKLLFTIRLNEQERAKLEEIKQVLDINSDGSALKIACFQGWDVLQRTLGKDYLRWLCDKNRVARYAK